MDHKLTPHLSLEKWSEGSKQFYSAGSAFSSLSCSAVVAISWGVFKEFSPIFNNHLVGLFLSFLIVFAYAKVIPEPPGYPEEGELVLTKSERIFGFFNSFIVYTTAQALIALQ